MGQSGEVMIMFSNRRVLGLCVAGVVAVTVGAAQADNITVSGVACKNFNAGEALDIDFVSTGVQNINASPRSVVCPVPRSPLTGAPVTQFFVDGANVAGTTTSCCAALYDFHGNAISTVCFAEGSTPTWDHAVNFSVAPGTWDYVSLVCTLPGSRGGTILGAASVGQ